MAILTANAFLEPLLPLNIFLKIIFIKKINNFNISC